MNFYDFNYEFGVIVTTIFLFVMAFVSYIFYKNEKLRSGLPQPLQPHHHNKI
jgi:hypothetical protein